MKPDAHQATLFADRPNGLFLVAVRVDGRRSHVEQLGDMTPEQQVRAATEWLWNDEVAWCILGYREKRIPYYSHRMVRRGEEITVKEWDGRERKASRSKVRPGQSADHLG